VITPWAFGHFLLRSQGVFALPVGKDSTQRSVQFSGAGSECVLRWLARRDEVKLDPSITSQRSHGDARKLEPLNAVRSSVQR